MTVALVSDYAIGDANLNNLMSSTDDQRKGFHQVSLTEMTTTTVPQVAAGSVFENNGALYEVTTNTSIGGSVSSGNNYIEFDPSTLSFSWASSLASWSDSKQGFYNSNNRHLLWEVVYQTTGTLYTVKRKLLPNNTGGIKLTDDYLFTRVQGFNSEGTVRTAGTSLAAEPNTVTSSVNLKPGYYELTLLIHVEIAAAAVTNCYAIFDLNKISGTATTEVYLINPSGDTAFNENGRFVSVMANNNPLTNEYFLAIKAVVYCAGPGTAVFGMYWKRFGNGTVTANNKAIFLTGLGYSE